MNTEVKNILAVYMVLGPPPRKKAPQILNLTLTLPVIPQGGGGGFFPGRFFPDTVYINLINMVNAFTNLQIHFIFSISQENTWKYLAFADKFTNTKGNQLLDMTQ